MEKNGEEYKHLDIVIKDLNGLKRYDHVGLYKKGHCVSIEKYNLACDYLEKINYSLQDIHTELQKTHDRSVLICVIAYICWIQESVCELKGCYKPYVFEDFIFKNMGAITENTYFLKAIRSFVLAHPFTTDRHIKYGFDGTIRCIDIRQRGSNVPFSFADNADKFYLDVCGKVKYDNQDVDYWLYIYNDNKYQNKFKQYIGISISSLCNIANDYIDYLYALDKHMSKINIKK